MFILSFITLLYRDNVYLNLLPRCLKIFDVIWEKSEALLLHQFSFHPFNSLNGSRQMISSVYYNLCSSRIKDAQNTNEGPDYCINSFEIIILLNEDSKFNVVGIKL